MIPFVPLLRDWSGQKPISVRFLLQISVNPEVRYGGTTDNLKNIVTAEAISIPDWVPCGSSVSSKIWLINRADPQGRRNGFLMGGGGVGITLTCQKDTILYISRLQLWFQISSELLAYFSLIAIHIFISCDFETLNFFWLAKHGGRHPPPPVSTAMSPVDR